jgi:hypothetical protein
MPVCELISAIQGAVIPKTYKKSPPVYHTVTSLPLACSRRSCSFQIRPSARRSMTSYPTIGYIYRSRMFVSVAYRYSTIGVRT